MKLTNGATVLRATINFERDVPEAVVLAKCVDEFATWNAYCNPRDGGQWVCEIGHYFRFNTMADTSEADAHAEALADYRERAARR